MSSDTPASDISVPDGPARPATYETSPYRQRARLITTATIAITLILLIGGTTLIVLVFVNDTSDEPSSGERALAELSAAITRESSDAATTRVRLITDQLNAELAGTGGTGEPGTGAETAILQEQLALATADAQKARQAVAQAQSQATDLRREAQKASETYNRRWIGYWVMYGASVLVAITVAAAIVTYARQEARRQFQNEQLEKKLAESADDFKLLPLLQHNRSQLLGYHTIVRNFAASSRQLAIRTIAVGFGFILLVSAATLFVDGTAGAIAASVVAASAAALTGFIGTAIIKNTSTSSKELVAFFRHPIETERVLTAERLIDSLPSEDKAAATMLLIKHLAGNVDEDRPGFGS